MTPNVQSPAALAENDTVVIGHTVFFDASSAQEYLDWTLIGNDAGDDLQGIGCVGPVNVTGLGIGEVPTFEFDLTCGDWRWVASNTDPLSTTNLPAGDSAPSAHEGMFLLTDYATTAAIAAYTGGAYDAGQLMSCANVSVNLGIEYAQVPGFNGTNGIDKFKKLKCKPVISCDVLIDDAMGVASTYNDLYTDYTSGTAKTVILQIGHTANNCIAFIMDKCYISACPKHTSINGLQGVSIQLTGTENDHGLANTILDSPITVNWF